MSVKKTKLQKNNEEQEMRLLKLARRELAQRYPQHKYEIRSGDWDQGLGIRNIIDELKNNYMLHVIQTQNINKVPFSSKDIL